MANILLVEDTFSLGLSLQLSLETHGHRCQWVTTLADARGWIESHNSDLVLLDLGLPDGDGLDFCHWYRERGSIHPILVLTARDTVFDRVAGLSAGADDYLTKPFELSELIARIEALLRRQRWHGASDTSEVGLLKLDFIRHQAWSSGRPITLTDLEFKLIRYLLDRKGLTVSREELLMEVWGQDPSTQTRTVDVFIGRIRRHIEPTPKTPRHLINVRGVGYRLLNSEDPSVSEN